jgi:multidrug resistance efflux pump
MALDLTQLQTLLNKAEQNEALISELQKQFKKARTAFDEMENLFDAKYVPQGRKARAATETDAEAPYGRKKDGTPKQRPGRTKAE